MCSAKTEREVRALPEWAGLKPENGIFVWLLANTTNERMWILQKPAPGTKETSTAAELPGATSADLP